MAVKSQDASGLGDHFINCDLLARASQSESPSEAVAYCNQILASDPAHLPALEVKCKTLWRLGEFGAALESLETVIALNPYDPGYHFLKGDCLQSLLRYTEALRALERCQVCATGSLAEQAGVRIKALQEWQTALAGELACSDAAFRRKFDQDPIAAMSLLGFKMDTKRTQPQSIVRGQTSIWARPS